MISTTKQATRELRRLRGGADVVAALESVELRDKRRRQNAAAFRRERKEH